MDLYDIIEMFLDWKAATERHADGDILKSIEINKGRFKMSEQLYEIFLNTALRYFAPLKDASPADRHWPVYTWTRGIFYYRVERNYFSGKREVIARIPRFLPDAEELTIKTTRYLADNR
jgi:hypothetical protein